MIEVDSAVEVFTGDLTDEWYQEAIEAGSVACDIETSGLDWRTDRIGTVQVATRTRIAVVVLQEDSRPVVLAQLLSSAAVQKVFHHAPFDLRFLAWQWHVEPRNVACTKVLSKILDPERPREEHSLKPVLWRHLAVTISKQQQVSNWLATELSPEQLRYAATDVAHLLDLADHLLKAAADRGLEPLVEASFAYLPYRVALDLRGSGDVFSY